MYSTSYEILFDFILMNVIYILSYRRMGDKYVALLPWLLVVLFCLFSFFGSDYFSYKAMFGFITLDFRDPLYYFIQELSCGSYLFFRLLIWGNALLLVYFTSLRLHVRKNVMIFVFSILFLQTFSYARASLAMSLYFFGLTFLFVPLKNRVLSISIAIFFLIFSFFAHRSMLPLIVLAPLTLVRINKKRFLLLLLFVPLFAWLLKFVMQAVLNDLLESSFVPENFTAAGNQIAGFENKNHSVRQLFIVWFKYLGFYIAYMVTMWKMIFHKKGVKVDVPIKRCMNAATIIMLIATSFFLTSANGATFAVAYRYLFMSGIPVSLGLASLYRKKLCTKKELLIVLCVPFAYSELILLAQFF